MRSFLVAALALAGSAMAHSTRRFVHCDVSHVQAPLPSGQTTLAVPSGQKAKVVMAGLGVQNYTCASTGKFSSVGAVAKLYDISCLHGSPVFSDVQDALFGLDSPTEVQWTLGKLLGQSESHFLTGDHYFVTNPAGSGLSPKFDFTGPEHNPNAFVLAAKTGDIASPDGPAQVDWLQLTNQSGDFAKTVFRILTKAGQPAATCDPTDTSVVSIPYTAQYWFYE